MSESEAKNTVDTDVDQMVAEVETGSRNAVGLCRPIYSGNRFHMGRFSDLYSLQYSVHAHQLDGYKCGIQQPGGTPNPFGVWPGSRNACLSVV